MIRARTALAVLMAAATVLAGCGDDDDAASGDEGATEATAGTGDEGGEGDDGEGGEGAGECDLLSVDEVEGIVDLPIDKVTVTDLGDCSFGTGEGETHIPVVNYGFDDAFPDADGNPTLGIVEGEPIEGLGDEALLSDSGTIAVLVGDQHLSVYGTGPSDDALIELAELVVERS